MSAKKTPKTEVSSSRQKRKTEIYVVDTNVPIVANARESNVSPQCILACCEALQRFNRDECQLAIDDQWLIIKEYNNKLHQSGQPGLGDSFLKWVLTNLWNPQRCVQVPITPDEEKGFREFPDDVELANFDKSDRKFVAVVRAHKEQPPVLEACDSDWWDAQQVLGKCGVPVKFLCPNDVRKAS